MKTQTLKTQPQTLKTQTSDPENTDPENADPETPDPQSFLKRFKLVSANVIRVLAAILNLVSFSLFDRRKSDKRVNTVRNNRVSNFKIG